MLEYGKGGNRDLRKVSWSIHRRWSLRTHSHWCSRELCFWFFNEACGHSLENSIPVDTCMIPNLPSSEAKLQEADLTIWDIPAAFSRVPPGVSQSVMPSSLGACSTCPFLPHVKNLISSFKRFSEPGYLLSPLPSGFGFLLQCRLVTLSARMTPRTLGDFPSLL